MIARPSAQPDRAAANHDGQSFTFPELCQRDASAEVQLETHGGPDVRWCRAPPTGGIASRRSLLHMGATTRPESPRLAAPPPPQVEQAAIRTVAYADVFDYPLHALDVHRYLHGTAATAEATEAALATCSALGGALSCRDGFYTLRGRESLVPARGRRATRADRLWPAALTYGRLIAGLPFVRMVAGTGSLAWHNVDVEGVLRYL